MVVSAQYLGKLLFWTFMALAPDAPSGRSLQTFLGQQLLHPHHQHHLLHDHHEAYLCHHDCAVWNHDHNNISGD